MKSELTLRSNLSYSTISKPAVWTARVLGAVVVLFWAFDTISHFMRPQPVVQAFAQLGFPLTLGPVIGTLQAILIVLYLLPRTRVLGATLLTGYLGGAVALQLRAGSPTFETIFPIIFGIMMWAPAYLLDRRVRALLPVSRTSEITE